MFVTVWLNLAAALAPVSCGAPAGTPDPGPAGGAGSGAAGGAGAGTAIDPGPGAGAGGAADTGGTGGPGGAGAGVACGTTAADSPAPAPDAVTFLAGVQVATLAGGAAAGSADGPPDTATLSNPVSLLVEPAGTLLVCDFDTSRVRRVDMAGNVTTVTVQAGFSRPFGLVAAADGSTYVDTDYDPAGQKSPQSGTLWRLDPGSGVATVVAADLGRPRGLGALGDGRLLLADYQNARVRLLDPATAAVTDVAGDPGCPGMADGQGTAARFSVPYGVALLPDGRAVVADWGNHRLRLVGLDGQVTSFAGDGGSGTVDGPRLAARFVAPETLAADRAGNIYVSDTGAHRIRRVGADGMVTTVAGDGTAGFHDGGGADAEFFGQEGLAVSADGQTLFVADGSGGETAGYNRVRTVTLPAQ